MTCTLNKRALPKLKRQSVLRRAGRPCHMTAPGLGTVLLKYVARGYEAPRSLQRLSVPGTVCLSIMRRKILSTQLLASSVCKCTRGLPVSLVRVLDPCPSGKLRSLVSVNPEWDWFLGHLYPDPQTLCSVAPTCPSLSLSKLLQASFIPRNSEGRK